MVYQQRIYTIKHSFVQYIMKNQGFSLQVPVRMDTARLYVGG